MLFRSHPVDPGTGQVVLHEPRRDDGMREVAIDPPGVAPPEVVECAPPPRPPLRPRGKDAGEVAVIERNLRDVEATGCQARDPGHQARAPHLDDVGALVHHEPAHAPHGDHEPVLGLSRDGGPPKPVYTDAVRLRNRVPRARERQHMPVGRVRLDVRRLARRRLDRDGLERFAAEVIPAVRG